MIARLLKTLVALIANRQPRFTHAATTAAAVLSFAVAVPAPALAVPTLQLDIEGGVYNSLTQTIVATGNPFTLYALLVPDSAARLTHTYYLAAALVPKTGPAAATLGSFSIGSTSPFKHDPVVGNITSKTIRVTEDMVYGVPPLENAEGHDAHDLAQHGIYETYFSEFAFNFTGADVTTTRANVYDSQTSAGTGPTDNASGALYYRAFTIDTSTIAAGYAIHFDLYNEQQRNNGDVDVKAFAPFSHDAQSLTSLTPVSSVPGPGTLILVVLGLLVAITLRLETTIARLRQTSVALIANRRPRVAHALTAAAAMFTLAVSVPAPALAVPTLQLDIEGGVYNSLTQTIVATGNPFTLYALLVPDSAARLTHTYYLAAALVPKTGPGPATLGSFSIGSTSPFMHDPSTLNITSKTIRVTQDMVYGVPPLEAEQGHDAHDLAQHGVYETYFSEFAFNFTGAGGTTTRANVYDSQTSTGAGPTDNASGALYYRAFTIDTSALAAGYAIHFDLYNEQQRNNGDTDVKAFAPFSHDAQSMTSLTPTSSAVPVPATLILVVLGGLVAITLRLNGRLLGVPSAVTHRIARA